MRRRKWQAAARRLTALALALCVLFVAPDPAAALVTQADIDALKGDAGDLKDQKKTLQAELDRLAKDKSQVMARKNNLDRQIQTTGSEIENVEAQIAGYEELIARSEEDLADAQRREEEQYALFCDRVRAMEEQGEISYWSVLFRANSFSELLGRLDIIN